MYNVMSSDGALLEHTWQEGFSGARGAWNAIGMPKELNEFDLAIDVESLENLKNTTAHCLAGFVGMCATSS